jgi:hypothetical protein
LDVNVTANNATTFDNVTLNINISDDFKGNVSVVVDNVTVYDGPVNDSIDIGKYSAGNKTANVTFYGDDNYANKTVAVDFTVTKVDLDVNVTAGNVSSLQNATVNITGIPDNYAGNVSVVVDNVTVYDGPVNSTIDIGKLGVGNKTANVTFYGDENYENKTVNVGFSVISTISAKDMKRGWASPYDYMATFLDENLTALKNANVTFIVGGKNYTAKTNDHGIAYLDSSNLAVGKYDVVIVNDATGENATATTTIVARIVENHDLTMDFMSGTYFTVRAIGDDGNPEVRGKYVLIKVNGVTYKRITDKNGYAKLIIRLNPKSYAISSEYKHYKVFNKLKVKQTLKLVKKTVTVKKTAKKLVIKAKLKWSNGKPIKGKKLVLKFKGKTYKAKTNKKGIAKFTVKKNVIKKLKKGKKYSFKVKYLKNKVKGKVKVKR